MSAPKRTTPQSIRQALEGHAGIRQELDRLENAANEQIRKTLPHYRYPTGELTGTFLDDLVEVVGEDDWRFPLESSADRLKRAATHIRKAVGLAVRAANGCPTYATIPSIVWESAPEAEAEWQRIAALPASGKLFGRGGAIESLRERQGRRVIDPRTAAPDFLRAMLAYATWCDREAAHLDCILKARDRRFDRLGPILKLIRDVQALTGKPHDARVAQLLTYASAKRFSSGAIRKIRERHLAS